MVLRGSMWGELHAEITYGIPSLALGLSSQHCFPGFPQAFIVFPFTPYDAFPLWGCLALSTECQLLIQSSYRYFWEVRFPNTGLVCVCVSSSVTEVLENLKLVLLVIFRTTVSLTRLYPAPGPMLTAFMFAKLVSFLYFRPLPWELRRNQKLEILIPELGRWLSG